MELLCAEENAGKFKNSAFTNYETPVRRRKRRKSQKWTSRNSGTLVRRRKRRRSQNMCMQEFLDSCARKGAGLFPSGCFRKKITSRTPLRGRRKEEGRGSQTPNDPWRAGVGGFFVPWGTSGRIRDPEPVLSNQLSYKTPKGGGHL